MMGSLHLSRHTACVQGVIEEIRDDTVIRSIRSDSDNTVVGEIAFFMGIAQPRQFLVRSDHAVLHCQMQTCQIFGSSLLCMAGKCAHRRGLQPA